MTAAPTKSPGLGRSTALMASGTAVSRVLGLVRGSVLVATIGMYGSVANSFAAANKLPNILYLLIAGGALNAVLVPEVVRAYRRADGQVYVDKLLTLGIVGLAGLTLALTAAVPLLTSFYVDFPDPEVTRLTIVLAYWCVPQVFFYGLYALLGQILNARGSFGPFMWAPVVNNIVAIAGLVVFVAVWGARVPAEGQAGDVSWWGAEQIAVLAGTATLGVVAQAFVLIVPLYRSGFRYRPRWGLRGSGLGKAGRVATWTFLGLVIGQVGVFIVMRVTTAAGAGGAAGNAVYDNAFLIFMLPHSLVTVSLATALFTRLSGRAAVGDAAGVRDDLSLGLRTVGLFTVLATTGIAVLAYPVARVIFPRITSAQASDLATVVVAMVAGLVAFGAWSLCQRVYYAYQDARSMVPIQIAMVVVVVGGTLLGQAVLDRELWVAAAGVSMTVSYGLGTVAALVALRRRLGGVDGRHVLTVHLKAVAAALPAAVAGALVVRLLGHVGGLVDGLVTCAVAGAVIVGVYVALLGALRVRELDALTRPVLRRIRGTRA
jgi:putative peptidoglycan lipid II flippase